MTPEMKEAAYQRFIRTAFSVAIGSAAALVAVFCLRLEGITIIPAITYQYTAAAATVSTCAAVAALLIRGTWRV